MDYLRREYDRVPLKNRVIVRTDSGKMHLGQCQNLSMGGGCISIFKETEEFKRGHLTLGYEYQGEIIHLKTSFTVQWRRPSRDHVDLEEIGIMFISVSDEARRNLVQILVYQMREQSAEEPLPF